jgi:predicted SprT family Zn-dependent metalloprotease
MTNTIPPTLKEIHSALENKMLDVLAILESHYKKPMPIPSLVLKPRIGRQLGFATKHNTTVTLNSDAFVPKYWDEMLNVTLGHEVCHLVAPIIYNRYWHGDDKHAGWSHGRAWKECMRVIGLPPDRCYDGTDTDLKELVSVRTVRRDFVYGCGCGETFRLTTRMHNNIKAGGRRRCRNCKTILVYKGEKV